MISSCGSESIELAEVRESMEQVEESERVEKAEESDGVEQAEENESVAEQAEESGQENLQSTVTVQDTGTQTEIQYRSDARYNTNAFFAGDERVRRC